MAPRGNGEGTHRFWESLILGAIPVTMRTSYLEPMYSIFPTLMVDDYMDVTEELLEANYDRLRMRWETKPQRWWMTYWLHNIRAKQREAVEI